MNRRPLRLTPKRWLPAAILALGLASLSPRAQDTNSIPGTNELNQPPQMTSEDELNPKDLEDTNEVADLTNAAPTQGASSAPTSSERSRWLQRQQQNRSRQPVLPPLAKASTPTNSASPLDFSAFQLITERNIFDPNRMPHSAPAAQAKIADAFSLVGTMSYAKGDFAFFDGTSSDYKKVLKPSESIAGYTVLAVSPDFVKLTRDNQQLELPVGRQMRRQDDGSWVESADAGSYAATPNSSSTNAQPAAAGGGSESGKLNRGEGRRRQTEYFA